MVQIGTLSGNPIAAAAGLKTLEILKRPGVKTAMLAALASFGVMVSVMNLSGYIVVGQHHHRIANPELGMSDPVAHRPDHRFDHGPPSVAAFLLPTHAAVLS